MSTQGVHTVNKKRPVNLNPATIYRVLPITAAASLLHRASGIVLVVATAFFLWMLDYSLGSAEGFAALQDGLQNPICMLTLWISLAALAAHTIAGIRHMIMDFGYGETYEGGVLGAKLVLFLTILVTIIVGVWIIW